MSINILDSSVYNRIAAGEVVERPSSVVKELVENSIDSGATKIEVAVADGGKYIRVSDNGCGIAYDELRTAFLPHATSKIREIKDLDAIGTLGFRGEALPSIASVAKVTMVSRRREDELGGEITIENGKELSRAQTGCAAGTTVTVEDLFKNVPARLKFLRADRSEENDITSLMQKIIIANYNVSVTYSVSGKEVFRSGGGGLKEALYAVYGKNFLNEYEFLQSSTPDITLYGYINKPAFSKHNRSYQTLVVNGRYVVNADISFWIYNCYSDYLMKRQYPAYVLFIDLPTDMVDINVHPSKMEVKFVDFDRLRRLLTKAISETLTAAVAQPKLVQLNQSDPIPDDSPRTPFMFAAESAPAKNAESYCVAYNAPEASETRSGANNARAFVGFAEPGNETAVFPKIQVDTPPARQYAFFHDLVAENSGIRQSLYEDMSDYRYRGELFGTYIMIEKGDEVVLIDQHAAHEKILYDEYSAAVNAGAPSVQDLLVPYIFDVDASEANLIDENAGEIRALGFELNRLSGNTYSLSAVPLVLSDIRLGEFAGLLLDALRRGRLSKQNFVRETLMQSACKAAVKGETELSDIEVKKLLETIAEKRIDLFCPHGRPIALKLKRSEIEKWFKRIV